MLNDMTRTRRGDMPPEQQARVDRLLAEFMAAVDALTEARGLQKGIARSQLPSSMNAVLGRDDLTIQAQFRQENRVGTYIQNPEISLTPQQAFSNASWESGFEDPFIIQFPAGLLDLSTEQRQSTLEKVASEHIDSEFKRFMILLSLMRTRPIFGPTPPAMDGRSVLLLLPRQEGQKKSTEAIMNAVKANGLVAIEAEDIRKGKSAVREMWESLNRSGLVIADLAGPDAEVMYGLGIAHTVGKETILLLPQGSRYLTDIPKTHRVEYEDSDAGRARLTEQLTELLGSLRQPIS